MNYREKVEYLKKMDQLSTSDPSVLRRYSIISDEVYDFERSVFDVILNEIINDKRQIEFLNNQIERTPDSEDLRAYCSDKINQHKENITAYGNQIYSMYTRESIISFFEKRKLACQERIEYSKKHLNDKDALVNKISLNNSLQELEEINLAINLLNGRDEFMLNSYLNMEDIGKKI